MLAGEGQAPTLPYLRFDATAAEDVELRAVDQSPFMAVIERVESAMAAVAARPCEGRGAFRIVVVEQAPRHRTIFLGREGTAGGLLHEALSACTGREYGPDDILFMVGEGGLAWYRAGEVEAIHLGVHYLACLVAAHAPPRARDTLYLAACSVMLLSCALEVEAYKRLTDDMLRMWVRDKIGASDPPEWGPDALEEVRRLDPWAATCMEGLGHAMRRSGRLELPAPLWNIAALAKGVQAAATFAEIETAGSA